MWLETLLGILPSLYLTSPHPHCLWLLVPLYWGITADGFVAFADDAELLKGACGKSFASFPEGCFFSTTAGEAMKIQRTRSLPFLLQRKRYGVQHSRWMDQLFLQPQYDVFPLVVTLNQRERDGWGLLCGCEAKQG